MRDLILASFVALNAQALLGCATATGLPAKQPAPVPAVSAAPPAPAASAPVEQAPNEPATEEAVAANAEAQPSEPGPIPRQCEGAAAVTPATNSLAKDSGKTPAPSCFPAPEFVRGLCAANYPGVALVMFHPESPWKRGYLKGETKAWTSAPGAQQEERLKFKEEVLVLQSNNGEGGSLAGQGDSFFALRWNGSCVKLTEEEITTVAPWAKVAAPVQWSWLDDNVQEALLTNPKVSAAQLASKKECRKSGESSAKCVTLTQQLTDAIVAQVRSGAVLPDPSSRPKLPAR